jgi:hypothetical protein
VHPSLDVLVHVEQPR